MGRTVGSTDRRKVTARQEGYSDVVPRDLPLACLSRSLPTSYLLPLLRPSSRNCFQYPSHNVPEKRAHTANLPNRPQTTPFSPSGSGSRHSMESQLGEDNTGKQRAGNPAERPITRNNVLLRKTSRLFDSFGQRIEKTDLEVRGKVGEGKSGSVLLATWVSMNRSVALKVLKPQQSFEQRFEDATYHDNVAAFQREIQLMQDCGEHPNIVPILGTGEHETMLVMEAASMDLQKLCQKAGSLMPLQLIAKWGRDILAAVAHIHACGIIHLDIKPSNILILKDRSVAKICDFGLASRMAEDLTVDRELCALWYRPPEVLMGCRSFSPLVDEWGVGVILLEMLMGEVPLPGSPSESKSRANTRKSHINYNADQLCRIFCLIGSPKEKQVCNLGCWKHFGAWQRRQSTLAAVVRDACNQRLITDVDAFPPDSDALAVTIKAWTAALTRLLAHVPADRLSAAQALTLPVFQHQRQLSSLKPPALRSPAAIPHASPLRIASSSSASPLRNPSYASAPGRIQALPRSPSAQPESPHALRCSSAAASITSTASHRSTESSQDRDLRALQPARKRSISWDHVLNSGPFGLIRARVTRGQSKQSLFEPESSSQLELGTEEEEEEEEEEELNAASFASASLCSAGPSLDSGAQQLSWDSVMGSDCGPLGVIRSRVAIAQLDSRLATGEAEADEEEAAEAKDQIGFASITSAASHRSTGPSRGLGTVNLSWNSLLDSGHGSLDHLLVATAQSQQSLVEPASSGYLELATGEEGRGEGREEAELLSGWP